MSSLTLAHVAEANYSPLPHGWEEQATQAVQKAWAAAPVPPSADGNPFCVPTPDGTICTGWCAGLWRPETATDFELIALSVGGINGYGVAYFPDVTEPGYGANVYQSLTCNVSVESLFEGRAL